MKTIEEVKEFAEKSIADREKSKNSIFDVLALRLILSEIRVFKEILGYIDSEESNATDKQNQMLVE